MPDTGLARLYRLHLIDAALHDMKMRAAALDSGKEEAVALKAFMAETEEARMRGKKLSGDYKDLELEVSGLREKKAKFEKQLFDGSISNSREAENVQKEIAMIGELINAAEERELALLDILPEAQKESGRAEKQIEEMQKAILRKRRKAQQEHEEIKSAYAEKAAHRAPTAKTVPEPLLKQYEALRAKLGVAMALITDVNTCSACGMHVPDKAVEMIKSDRVIQCEQCRRILFSPIPTL